MFLYHVLNITVCLVVGIAESHLINDTIVDVNGYSWQGFNRKHFHVPARYVCGSVGLLIRDNVCRHFNIDIVDNDTDRIFQVKLEDKTFALVCVIYVLPKSSTRAVNVNDFFETLVTKVYMIPKDSPFYLCGDQNSRCSDFSYYIAGETCN